jgi:hypothetical protein
MLSAIGAQLLAIRAAEISAVRIWIGRAISGLMAAFMLFDAAAKFAKPALVIDAFARTSSLRRAARFLGWLAIIIASSASVRHRSVS